MSTAAGSKYYPVSVIDITGSYVPNVAAGWEVISFINGVETIFTNPTVVQVTGANGLGTGQYVVNINAGAGNGGIFFYNTLHPSFELYPQMLQIEDNVYDTDSIYGRFLQSQAIQSSPSSVNYAGPFSAYTATDFIQPIVIPASLLGTEYGGDGVDLVGWSATVGSTTPLISGGTATITNAATNQMTISVSRYLLPKTLLITQTEPVIVYTASLPIQFDVVGTSPTGLKRVISRFTVNLFAGQDTND